MRTGGEICPHEFIPVAEESGLILQLGRWAMDRALHTLADWDRAAGEALPLYVGGQPVGHPGRPRQCRRDGRAKRSIRAASTATG